ncbi:extracellular solute-binding protein [Anaerocolumna sp. MB42-C2]|uniref:extracellular solute-binding protein n=1 Tax=Anaerocolumna sp. MB42-C2 TaxID=3070997 RepID=UPI0027E0270B|nr:extracellular solute-binding protein [Anaerocolumna sp. MB42-C2]WMJ86789.1 extracellular solute-binding protein [Anaerocolumna sp. MB42-C2]
MGTIKRGVCITIGVLIIILGLISVVLPHKEDSVRKPTNFEYQSNMDENRKVSDNQIMLKLSEASNLENVDYKDIDDTETGYLFDGQGKASWKFNIKESGEYNISAGYLPVEGNGQDIQFNILIDNINVSKSDKIASLPRLWVDIGNFTKTSNGDEIRPEQSEIHIWTENNFVNNFKGDILVHLDKGEHTIDIINKRENCMIDFVCLYSKRIVPYKEYSRLNPGTESNKNYFQTIEAETPYVKSSSELYPIYDKSSPYTSPYNSTCIRYNTIGGQNWSDEGQWIEWKINVPSDGYYQIGMRYRQNLNKGVASSRTVTIDGDLPFKELANVKFSYSINWQNEYLGGDEPYLFYLSAGQHTLRMKAVLGELSDITEKMESTVYNLNSLYRDIIMITGTEPDIYRDYNLQTSIPGLLDKLTANVDELTGYEQFLEKQYGKNSYASRVISQLKRQLQAFIQKPYKIQKGLPILKTNISSMSEWVLAFEQQPLELDCFYITSPGVKLPKAETNLLGMAGHEIRAFVGSFFHEYSNVSSVSSKKDTQSITVWIGKGRDQANVIKRMIDDKFTKETRINVNLNLVEGALVKASIAGKGPDVNIFTTRGEAMNLAFRGALLPLNDFDNFNELTSQYMKSAFVPYGYNKSTYAIPEEQVFYMMFVRTDILDSLGVSIPKTWEELMKIMPVLQASNLEIGLPYTDGYATMNSGIGTINLLPTLLAQRGNNIYNKDNTKTMLASSEAYKAFKSWTDFYTMYDFPLYKDDFSRFRTGEMPIIISPYTLYNTLFEAAPEISGQWVMTTIPGTLNDKNELNISTGASGSCSIILKDCDNKDAAWKFVKWWNSADTQATYSKEIEAELGVLGRYTPANSAAFEKTTWYDEEKEVLLKQWYSVIEIPEVPGGYYVSRNIDNAFREVYYNGGNARENLYYWMNSVNEELARKQNQMKARKEN